MAWDPTIPATNAALLSAPVRENFQALDALMGADGQVWPLLAPDGSAAAPSYSFASEAGLGFYRSSANYLTFSMLGTDAISLGPMLALTAESPIAWSATSTSTGATQDVSIGRDGAAGTLYLTALTGAASLRVYGLFTDPSNYERAVLTATPGSGLTLAAQTGGTGADNLGITLTPAGTGHVALSAGGLVWPEIAAPATPPANTVIAYAKADGQLYSQDDAGVETVLGGGGGGVTYPLLAPDGSMAAPSYSFSAYPGTGMFLPSAAAFGFTVVGNTEAAFTSGAFVLSAGRLFGWAAGYAPGGMDTVLQRDAANIIAQKLTGFQKFRVYADATNYLQIGGDGIEFWVPTVPATPATGRGVLYLKNDKKLYFKDDAGLETALF